MSRSAIATILESQEDKASRDLAGSLNKALIDKRLQTEVDKKTRASSAAKKPPSDIYALYAREIDGQTKKAEASYPGMIFSVTDAYAMVKDKWTAKVTVAARYKTASAGGGKYRVTPGDTLWSIAKSLYGHGAYWQEIADANPRKVASKGNFILAGVELDIPKAEVPSAVAKIAGLPASDSIAKKPACEVGYPKFDYDFAKSGKSETVIPFPGGALKVTVSANGKMTVGREGTIPVGFTLSGEETKAKIALNDFTTSFNFKDANLRSITLENKFCGRWAIKWTYASDGVAGELAISTGPVKVNGFKLEGNIGFKIEVRVLPKVKAQKIDGTKADVVVDLLEGSIYLLAGVVVVVVVGELLLDALAVAGAGAAVSYAMALRMSPMILLQFAK